MLLEFSNDTKCSFWACEKQRSIAKNFRDASLKLDLLFTL